ncbi:hypothetical protein KUTeg_021429, partial [Tegillarca granosa]
MDDINLKLGELDLTSEDFWLDEVDVHIQKNLEDEIVKEALNTGVDLRQYSKQIEKELLNIKESQNIASLHKQIAACDTILESDLSSISTEIQSLQEQSITMNVKLKNRQAIRGELSQFVDEMVIPEAMINHILDTPVTEREFLEQLHELNHKINFVKEQSFKDARSCLDVKDILEKLKIKKPMSNYQIPQNAMLKFRFFNEFLMANERHTAREYEEVADKEDLMGPTLKNRSTVFTLGSRGNILTTDLESPIIVPHAAQKADTKYNFESLFRSLHFALMDNCSREYLFLVDFFMVSGTAALDLFNAIMGKTLTFFLKQMDEHVKECFDSIGIFLYWETLLFVLWPKFEHVIELNIHSVRDVDPQKLGHIDNRPHYITRRYAEFSAAILGINQSFPDDRVERLLERLQTEVENFILKMAAEFPQRKEQLIFLINNYDMLLGVLMERTTEDSKESESFKELLTARTQEFIEEILSPHFGGMISFVKDCEVHIERGSSESLRHEERRVQQIVKGFNSDWKRALEFINGDVMRAFTNFKNGTQILQGALTQLIQYYHRFQKVLSQGPFRNMQIRNELINIHHVMIVTDYKVADCDDKLVDCDYVTNCLIVTVNCEIVTE